MPVEAQHGRDHPGIAAMSTAIQIVVAGQPFLDGVDAILTALSRTYAQGLVATEGQAGEANEARIGKLIDEYAEMLKQTVLIEVLDLKGRN